MNSGLTVVHGLLLLSVVGCPGADGGDSHHSELCPHWGVRTGPEDNSWSLPGNGCHYHCIVRGKLFIYFVLSLGMKCIYKVYF